jgi:aspartyl-tRNA(Asn)/glutamyl-tRNA(Gln) amidotransferase subunit C
MTISKEEVQKVAMLARLRLSEREVEQFTPQLNQILQFAEKLNQLDTAQVRETYHVLPIHNRLREDEVASSLEREKGLSNAPESEEGLFQVPAIFAGE